jgi:hypothetical protein
MFSKLTNEEQVAQMRKFLNEHYKIFEDYADCKLSHRFQIHKFAFYTIDLLFEDNNTKIKIEINSALINKEITIKKLNNVSYIKRIINKVEKNL